MQIGHSGRTRVEEFILAVGVLVLAVRTMLPPPGPTIYPALWLRPVFACFMLIPVILILTARTLESRKRGLLGLFITYFYTGGLSLFAYPEFWGYAGAILTLAALSIYLYFVTRLEITWVRQRSAVPPPEKSSPPP